MNFTQIPSGLSRNPQFLRYWEILKINPASIVFVPMAELLRDHHCLEEARKWCEQGLKYNKESVSGRLLLASIYSKLGRKQEAQQTAHEILLRMPGHPEALRYMERKPVQTEASKIKEPEAGANPWETVTMIDILIAQHAYAEATRLLRKLMEQNPLDPRLKSRQERLQHMLNEEEETVA